MRRLNRLGSAGNRLQGRVKMSALEFLPFAALLIGIAALGVTWRRARVMARRRFRSALDAFAKLQIDREPSRKAIPRR
jgi:hypothetical protein